MGHFLNRRHSKATKNSSHEETHLNLTMTDVENTTPEDERKLFVGGLPQEAKEADIKEYFEQFGEIDNINLKTDPHTGRSRGFASSCTKTRPASAELASTKAM